MRPCFFFFFFFAKRAAQITYKLNALSRSAVINFEINKDVQKLNRILFLGGFEGADGVNRKFSENQTKPAPYLVDLSFIVECAYRKKRVRATG